jgi:signal peptidase I
VLRSASKDIAVKFLRKQPRGKGTEARRKHWIYGLLELMLTAGLALGIALGVQAFVVKPYKIPSGSMEPTLAVGQRVLVNRLSGNPHVGEIVVFHPPVGAEEQQCGTSTQPSASGGAACDATNPHEASVNFIKRVVAGPGDEIYIAQGHVYRKAKGATRFVREHDSYIRPCAPTSGECNFLRAVKIPPGHWFMMGDNRGNSDDSRFWGPVPTSWIIGEAIFTYWPLNRVGTL